MHKINYEEQIAEAVEQVVGNKPANWSKRSIAPYYNEKYGKDMVVVLQDMMQSREDQIFEYDYFKSKFNISKKTLYLRINQSMRYALERLDDTSHTLGRFCSMLEVKKLDTGVVIRFKPECRNGDITEFKPKPILAREELPIWQSQLDTYLEEAKPGDKPLFIDKLALTSSEIENIKNSMRGLKGVMFSVTAYSIKVILTHND